MSKLEFRGSVTVALLLLLLPVFAVACGPPESKVRVVLITLDTLRYDRFAGTDGSPSSMPLTWKWSQAGHNFERFYSATATTLPTHVSFLTGLHPWQHGVSRNGLVLGQESQTIVEILKSEGFHTAAVVSSAPLHRNFGVGQGFDVFRDDFDLNTESRTKVAGQPLPGSNFYSLAESVTASAMELLDGTDDPKQFFWFHYFDPHAPYGDCESQTMLTQKEIRLFRKQMQERRANNQSTDQPMREIIQTARALYDEDLIYLDRSLDGLIRRLVEDEEYTTHVLVVSDHGETLGERNRMGHGKWITLEAIHVPCFLISPALTSRTRRDAAGSIDVPVTLLSWAGVDHSLPGRDLSSDDSGGGNTGVFGMQQTFATPTKDEGLDGTVSELEEPLFFLIHEGEVLTGNKARLRERETARIEGKIEQNIRTLFESFEEQLSSSSAKEITDPEAIRALKELGYLQE